MRRPCAGRICVFDISRMTRRCTIRRTGAFFGRRKGHPLRAAAGRAVRDAAAAARARSHDARAGRSAHAVRRRGLNGVDDVRLEIGFGGAEHLIAQAERHPRTGFIGVEPFVNGMAKALAAIDERKLAQHPPASRRRDRLARRGCRPPSLARVDLLYPDPWPKRRHWKRRFVQDAASQQIARMLRPGGEFRFASDIAGLRGLDAVAAAALARFRLDRRARRRLAASRGRTSPARATRPRPSAKAARRAI